MKVNVSIITELGITDSERKACTSIFHIILWESLNYNMEAYPSEIDTPECLERTLSSN